MQMNITEFLSHISSPSAADSCFTFWVLNLLLPSPWLEMQKFRTLEAVDSSVFVSEDKNILLFVSNSVQLQ